METEAWGPRDRKGGWPSGGERARGGPSRVLPTVRAPRSSVLGDVTVGTGTLCLCPCRRQTQLGAPAALRASLGWCSRPDATQGEPKSRETCPSSAPGSRPAAPSRGAPWSPPPVSFPKTRSLVSFSSRPGHLRKPECSSSRAEETTTAIRQGAGSGRRPSARALAPRPPRDDAVTYRRSRTGSPRNIR